jgi:hypothetical protein
MKTRKSLIHLACFVAMALSLRASAEPAVSVGISLDSQNSTLGAPVLVKMRLQSNVDVRISLGSDMVGALELLLRDPSGATRQITLPIGKETYAVGGVSLGANKAYDEILVLPAGDFTQPGVYGLRVTISPTSNPPFEYLDPGFLKITVAPYSQKSMGGSCAELATKLAAGSSASEWDAYAGALANIRDPVALPYLNKSLGLGFGLDEVLIQGIEHIGNVEAVIILAGAMDRKGNSDLSNSAKMALERLAQSASDLEVRKAAKSYLP